MKKIFSLWVVCSMFACGGELATPEEEGALQNLAGTSDLSDAIVEGSPEDIAEGSEGTEGSEGSEEDVSEEEETETDEVEEVEEIIEEIDTIENIVEETPAENHQDNPVLDDEPPAPEDPPVAVVNNCTRTLGYWKNHAGFGPQPDTLSVHLPIWLGTASGTQSVQVESAQLAVDILKMKLGHPSNGITKLYAQLLTAKLNLDGGADDSAVANVMADADSFLANHAPEDWAGLAPMDQSMVLEWVATLDDFNNGLIGPGHCP